MKLFITDRQLESLVQLRSEAIANENKLCRASTFNIEDEIEKRGATEMEFDFNHPNISVLSVERVRIGTMEECTNIGYYFKDSENTDNIKEWHMMCSRENHNRLVKNFQEHINYSAAKKNSKVLLG